MKGENTNCILDELKNILPIEILNFLKFADKFYYYINQTKIGLLKEDIEVLSIYIANYYYNFSSNRCFEENGIFFKDILDYIDVDINKDEIEKLETKNQIFAQYFFKYIKNENDFVFNIDDILYNLCDSMVNKSSILEKILELKEIKSNENIYNLIKKSLVKRKHEIQKGKEIINWYDKDMQDYLKKALIEDQKIRLFCKENNRMSEEDITVLSLLLALDKMKNWHFFEEKGMSIQTIVNFFHLQGIEYISVNQVDYQIFYQNYKRYCFDRYYFTMTGDKVNTFCSVEIFARRLFDDSMNKSKIIKQITKFLSIDFEVLKKEIVYGKPYVETLTLEERIAYLKKEAVFPLNSNQLESILKFGKNLNVHLMYIHNYYASLIRTDTHDQAIEVIFRMSKQLSSENKEISFFKRIFRKSIFPGNIDSEIVNSLKIMIERVINTLSKELLEYETFKSYIEVYREKNNEHYMILYQHIQRLNNELNILEIGSQYDVILDKKLKIQHLENKLSSFMTTDQMLNQELLEIYQRIATHFITVQTLERIYNHVLPLILSQPILSKKLESEKKKSEVIRTEIFILQNLLSKNIVGVKENLKYLHDLQIMNNDLSALDVDGFIQMLDNQIIEQVPAVKSLHNNIAKKE